MKALLGAALRAAAIAGGLWNCRADMIELDVTGPDATRA